MRRHFSQPFHAGGLEADVGVETAGDGAVDNALLHLVQQPDELSLRADIALDAPVRVVEEPRDGRLFGQGWNNDRYSLHAVDGEVPLADANTVRHFGEEADVGLASQ